MEGAKIATINIFIPQEKGVEMEVANSPQKFYIPVGQMLPVASSLRVDNVLWLTTDLFPGSSYLFSIDLYPSCYFLLGGPS